MLCGNIVKVHKKLYLIKLYFLTDEKLPVPTLNNNANVAPISQPTHHAQTIGIAPPASATVQPLPSNVLNKPADAQRDAQYMQQNQIFVFSTSLANEGADAVNQHRFPSIIAFHCEQPGTKAFLEVCEMSFLFLPFPLFISSEIQS